MNAVLEMLKMCCDSFIKRNKATKNRLLTSREFCYINTKFKHELFEIL